MYLRLDRSPPRADIGRAAFHATRKTGIVDS
jgi:hypothetical protein